MKDAPRVNRAADVTPRRAHHPGPSKTTIDCAAIRTPRRARASGRKPVRGQHLLSRPANRAVLARPAGRFIVAKKSFNCN
jgi:hypothetical protein